MILRFSHQIYTGNLFSAVMDFSSILQLTNVQVCKTIVSSLFENLSEKSWCKKLTENEQIDRNCHASLHVPINFSLASTRIFSTKSNASSAVKILLSYHIYKSVCFISNAITLIMSAFDFGYAVMLFVFYNWNTLTIADRITMSKTTISVSLC